MARVKCIMMQRNEGNLLVAWIQYYGYLFGFNNLVVFDNGSTDPEVVKILKGYELVGVTVRYEFTGVEHFHHKHLHFRNVIQHLDATETYDFALPVDCDEFLALLTPHGLTCDREEIHAHLDGFLGEQRVLRISESFYNSLKFPGCFWPDRYPKNFIPSGQLEYIDHGFHALTSKGFGTDSRATALTYIHMHNKPFDTLLEHAERKLTGFVDTSDRTQLAQYCGPGVHLVKYFFMTEDEYVGQSDDRVLVMIPYFINLLRVLGVYGGVFGTQSMPSFGSPNGIGVVLPNGADRERRVTETFNGAFYYHHNKDVESTQWPAILHFLYFGFQEGRRY